MSLQSERLLNHRLRLRLSHLPNCHEAIAEEASAKNLPYLDFFEQSLEAESQPSIAATLGRPADFFVPIFNRSAIKRRATPLATLEPVS